MSSSNYLFSFSDNKSKKYISKNIHKNFSNNLSKDLTKLKPFISICIIISFLFFIVFLKMEERRMSYVILKTNKDSKKFFELKKQKEIQLARLSKPQLVETVAKQKLTLKRASQAQIIHINPSISLAYLDDQNENIQKTKSLTTVESVVQNGITNKSITKIKKNNYSKKSIEGSSVQ